ncbi:phospholipase A2 inhibitor and Ly6/PLAUR domain-containing protein-like [Engystomops pustulosus]|uniref:phospholipase A2 inhibitor and Ly6/PLAUR domain-containing protein-like n=1 Tax=Engystomops pustulosus TaxID=76066 RepID=UPI003AFA74B5
MSCHNATSSTCNGSSVTCPSGSLCASSLLEYTIGAKTFGSYFKGCAVPAECNAFEVSFRGIQMNMATKCCSTDDCTPSVPIVPRINNVTNGLVCPSCFNVSSTCDSPNTVECRGSEDRCLYASLEVQGIGTSATVSSRACATQNVCDLMKYFNTKNSITRKVTYECSSDATSVRAVILPPAVTCLLLLKWLF